jgi:hypothetical protein
VSMGFTQRWTEEQGLLSRNMFLSSRKLPYLVLLAVSRINIRAMRSCHSPRIRDCCPSYLVERSGKVVIRSARYRSP